MIVTFLAAARSRAARRSPRSISRRVSRATDKRPALVYAPTPSVGVAIPAPSLSVPGQRTCCQRRANSSPLALCAGLGSHFGHSFRRRSQDGLTAGVGGLADTAGFRSVHSHGIAASKAADRTLWILLVNRWRYGWGLNPRPAETRRLVQSLNLPVDLIAHRDGRPRRRRLPQETRSGSPRPHYGPGTWPGQRRTPR